MWTEQGEHVMSLTEITVEGTLNGDGSLGLDQKLSLSPGRVTITVRQDTQATLEGNNWWQAMQDTRRKMEEAGCHFMDEKEVQEHISWLRERDSIDELLQEADAKKP